MEKYHKIQTIFKRNLETKYKTLLEGEFSLPEFEYLKDNEWIFTEKVDGTNIRVIFDGENVTFGGKTDRAQIQSGLVNYLHKTFLPKLNVFKEIFQDDNGNTFQACLYGEGYGSKIQKGGGNYRSDQGFVLFDVKIGEWWLQRENIEGISISLDLDIIPIIGKGTIADMVKMVRQGFDSTWGNFRAEGIVARPAVELKSRNGKRIITKIKHKDFNGVDSDNG